MQSVFIVLYLTILGSAFSQGRGQFRNRGLDEKQEKLSALDRMMNVTTMEEFMSLLRVNGRPVTEHHIYSRYPSSAKLRISAQGGFIADADQCSPREMTVDLDLPDSAHGVVYFPRCTRLMRCGGCCASRHVSCVPDQIETRTLSVVKGQVPFATSDHLIFSGFQKVQIERHLSCRLQCDLSQEKCGSLKVFLPHQCACACAKMGRCYSPRVWDPETCRCVCSERQRCPRGLKVNKVNCRCEIENHSDRLEIAHVSRVHTNAGKYLNQHRLTGARRHPGSSSRKQPETFLPGPAGPPGPPSGRAARPSLSETKQNPECPGVLCPPSFSAVYSERTLCACVPNAPLGTSKWRRNARRQWLRKRRN